MISQHGTVLDMVFVFVFGYLIVIPFDLIDRGSHITCSGYLLPHWARVVRWDRSRYLVDGRASDGEKIVYYKEDSLAPRRRRQLCVSCTV